MGSFKFKTKESVELDNTLLSTNLGYEINSSVDI